MKQKPNIKKIIKSPIFIFITIVMVPFLAFGMFLLAVPISRPNEYVRDYVLREIPMGTSWDNAIKIIAENKWYISESRTEQGLCIYPNGSAYFANANEMLNGPENVKDRIVGTKAMFVQLGVFYGPTHTAVFAWLEFDENDELVEAVIRRDIDSL